MKVAVVGCTHGELDIIYEAIALLETQNSFKVEIVLCCGDFQAVRNSIDLKCMAAPEKYQQMCSFHRYYSGDKIAPILTIFIGGNHEATNYLQELPFGGWVAPNIYYLGYAGVVNYKGIRIGGLSGIFKAEDYLKGHHEFPPYTESTKRSAYHVRNLEIFRLSQIIQPIDLFLSHDWPQNITKYGNVQKLLQYKPFLSDDIYNNRLGNPTTETLLTKIKPAYWFSAHLHCKFAAVVKHSEEDSKSTKFLALDKCLPRRSYMQILDISPLETKASNSDESLYYDLEWLTILKLTDHLLSVEPRTNYMPGANGNERYQFAPSDLELKSTEAEFGDMKIPLNFSRTGPIHSSQQIQDMPALQTNPQTQDFCKRLGINDPNNLLMKLHSIKLPQAAVKVQNPSEIHLSDEEQDLDTDNMMDLSEGFVVDKKGNTSTNESKVFKRRNLQYYTSEVQDD